MWVICIGHFCSVARFLVIVYVVIVVNLQPYRRVARSNFLFGCYSQRGCCCCISCGFSETSEDGITFLWSASGFPSYTFSFKTRPVWNPKWRTHFEAPEDEDEDRQMKIIIILGHLSDQGPSPPIASSKSPGRSRLLLFMNDGDHGALRDLFFFYNSVKFLKSLVLCVSWWSSSCFIMIIPVSVHSCHLARTPLIAPTAI